MWFVEFFDKFFDSMNINNFSAGYKSRNPFKSPYRSGSDFRLKVCRNLVNYYGYLMLVCSIKYYSGLQKSSSHTWMNGRKVCKLDQVSQKHRCRKCSWAQRLYLAWESRVGYYTLTSQHDQLVAKDLWSINCLSPRAKPEDKVCLWP